MIEGRRRRLVKLASLAAAAVIGVATTGCEVPETPMGVDGEPAQPTTTTKSSTPAAPTTGSSAQADATDYSRLLLQPADVSTDQDTFTVRTTNPGPDGLPGASALFVNIDDTRAITNTLIIYPDAQTATATLRGGLPQIDMVVANGAPEPVLVGADGTMIVGTSADGTKSATLLMFTEGPALAQLKFESALGDVTDESYVVSVGKMQQIALRTGLGNCS